MAKPEWLDHSEYPFQSRYFDTDQGRMHYIDEGQGKPVVFLHGNPDWSFSFRNVINGLKAHYRCIAPDYLGFGLSDKPVDFSYKPWLLARNVEQLLLFLDLTNVTLVINDWGGPIGFHFAIRNPERVSNLVIMNTWMWPLNQYPLFALFSRFMSGYTGKLLTGQLNVFAKWLVWLAIYDKKRFNGNIHKHYQMPFAKKWERIASIQLPRFLLEGKDWFTELYENRDAIQSKNSLLIWGLKDPAFGRYFLEAWQEILPSARVLTFSRAGHFPHECQSMQVRDAIAALLANKVD